MRLDLLTAFRALPQHKKDIWLGGQYPLDVQLDDVEGRPILSLWRSNDTGQVMGINIGPTDESAANRLAESVFAGSSESPKERPSGFVVQNEAQAEALATILQLEDTHIYVDPKVDDYLSDFVEEISGSLIDGGEGLAAVRGTQVDDLRDYAQAAAEFFKAAPWELVGEQPIRVMEPDAPLGMAVFCMMGSAGIERGITFFENEGQVSTFGQLRTPADFGRLFPKGVWSLNFGDKREMPPRDLELWKQHRLPLASKNAYPLLRLFIDEPFRVSVNLAQLRYVTGLLRALSQMTPIEVIEREVKVKITRGPDEAFYHLKFVEPKIRRDFAPGRTAKKRSPKRRR